MGRAAAGETVRVGPRGTRRGAALRGRAAAAMLALAACACSSVAPDDGLGVRFRRIRPEVAHYLLRDSPETMLLDLRPEPRLDEPVAELRGARWLPLAELTARVGELEPYRNRTFLVYCGGDRLCGERGMQILVRSGLVYAVLVDGGLDDWADELPAPATEVEPEPPPSSSEPPL